MSKKGKCIKFKNFGREIKSTFMIFADCESILVPEDNGKQNLNETYINKYRKYVACSYGYKLVCVEDLVSLLNHIRQRCCLQFYKQCDQSKQIL